MIQTYSNNIHTVCYNVLGLKLEHLDLFMQITNSTESNSTESNSTESDSTESNSTESDSTESDSTESDNNHNDYVEYGTRLSMTTPWCTNAMLILNKCGIKVTRIERSYLVDKNEFNNDMIDNMTQEIYPHRLMSFNTELNNTKIGTYKIPSSDFKKFNDEHQLAFDEDDLSYYRKLFTELTNVELFDLAQSNSEHSRHWIFGGKIGDHEESLFDLVKKPHKNSINNSVIAFKDNSSAIQGYQVNTLVPSAQTSSKLKNELYHPTLTAETHNFPTGIAPFPGAATGTGGRIRDNQAVGRGGRVCSSIVGYCVGDLNGVHGARARKIEIEASNGASDYGNKFGEPVIQGFTRGFTTRLQERTGSGFTTRLQERTGSGFTTRLQERTGSGFTTRLQERTGSGFTTRLQERTGSGFDMKINNDQWGWYKPIMFSAGIGQLSNKHIEKRKLNKGNLVVRLGGPAYKIGIGGGSASSRQQTGEHKDIDTSAVQRGDPQMENKLNRVIRACIELPENPILSIHDQGAGGMGNVTKEIAYPNGALIDLTKVDLGDPSMTDMEIWVSEHQEQNTCVIDEKDRKVLEQICRRENLGMRVVGSITDTGRIKVIGRDGNIIVDLDLDDVLGKVPQKHYPSSNEIGKAGDVLAMHPPIKIKNKDILHNLKKVFKTLQVGSKRFLVNKVDRSVTGLIAQQQCVGPLQIALSNVAITAQSHFPSPASTGDGSAPSGLYTGIATAVGEQPTKSFIDCGSSARLSVGEMLTNMVWAKISKLEDIKCSVNWMWPANFTGEKEKMHQAAQALSDMMIQLGIAIDGGKDSLSMSAVLTQGHVLGELIKCPRTIVVTGYCTVPDVCKSITPDFKKMGSDVLYVPISGELTGRLGCSVLAYVNDQIGNECPDLTGDNIDRLKYVFNKIQEHFDLILSGHDVSDGGLITTICEMCFAGNMGCKIHINRDNSTGNSGKSDYLATLFAEELGLAIEVDPVNTDLLMEELGAIKLGKTGGENVTVYNLLDGILLDQKMTYLRDIWESTSYEMELLQTNKKCADIEYGNLKHGVQSELSLTFDVPEIDLGKPKKHKIAILREEGSNGDREMASAFYIAGFDVYDVCMNDLLTPENTEGMLRDDSSPVNGVNLDDFRGLVFVGGFSFSDVFGAGVGWYNVIKNNSRLNKMFNDFYNREDTFSFGVCNGCQVMSLLGWVPHDGSRHEASPKGSGVPTICKTQFIQNESGRFESRFSTVMINKSNSIMLKDMEGSVMGVWNAHGEGKCTSSINDSNKCIVYVDDENEPTEEYPFNPNGSVGGVTGICSDDGRHLAMMPHPERCFLDWQVPYHPNNVKREGKYTGWIKMFVNAYEWCDNN
jgi:phosphoribosylformylglycinamidine synthase